MNIIKNLVGGLEHGFYFHFMYGMSSFPLTNSNFSRCFFKPPTSYSWPTSHIINRWIIINNIDNISSHSLIIRLLWISSIIPSGKRDNITIENHHAIFMGKLTTFRLGHFQVRKLAMDQYLWKYQFEWVIHIHFNPAMTWGEQGTVPGCHDPQL